MSTEDKHMRIYMLLTAFAALAILVAMAIAMLTFVSAESGRSYEIEVIQPTSVSLEGK